MVLPGKNKPSNPGVAFVWVSRILAVTLEMVLPGLVGQWLDGRLGTSFLVLVGFGCGIALAIWHLLLMTRVPGRADSQGEER
jgi:hypothetical protein